MIIGVSGKKRSGKDTLGAALVRELGFTRVAFADGVRELVAATYGWPLERVQSEEFKEVMVIEEDEMPPQPGVPRALRLTGRDLLQRTGMAARKVFGDDVWIKVALAKCGPQWCERCGNTVQAHEAMGASSGCAFKQHHAAGNYVITDVRFPNEVRAIKAAGGKVIRLNTAESAKTLHDYKQAEIAEEESGFCCHGYGRDVVPVGSDLCDLPRAAHPASWSDDHHVSETSLPDQINDAIHYDAVTTGDLDRNTREAVSIVQWLTTAEVEAYILREKSRACPVEGAEGAAAPCVQEDLGASSITKVSEPDGAGGTSPPAPDGEAYTHKRISTPAQRALYKQIGVMDTGSITAKNLPEGFCCLLAFQTVFLSHNSDCRVWSRHVR